MSVKATVSYEAPGYEAALSCARIDVTRTGAGRGPNTLLGVTLGGTEILSGFVQFPVIGRGTISDDTIAVSVFVEAPPGTRWCEIDVSPGDVLVYGPGAEHVAVSPVGVEYRSALIDRHKLDELAEALEVPILRPARGSVTRLDRTAAVKALASELNAVASSPHPSQGSPATSDGVLRATARVLSDPSPPSRGHGGRIESCHLVSECIRYADTIGRRPSLSELCLAVHVSERRLRSAFHDTLNMAPSAFFRSRWLSRARTRLVAGGHSVTEVAVDLGFEHLGRFAEHYTRIHGEYPRETLARARSTTAGRHA